MTRSSEPPSHYQAFVKRYPHLGEAWEAIRAAEEDGPLDPRTQRLVKLGVAIGALKEGAVHSAARKALAAGSSPAELQQVVALAAATVGLPSTVAAFSWVQDILGQE
jgi:alkylhydroperoxidase/carboxymuconolactone decarboxylase family protein YurZ